jgi:hypothetical protein
LAVSTSRDDRDERDVEEAEGRGESAGVTAAEDSESVAVAAVAVRRRTGFLGRAVVAAGMIAALYRAGGIN